MADVVLGVVLENLVTIIQHQAHYVREFPDQLSKLKIELQFMQSYINDTDQVKKKDQKKTLKMITQHLKDLLYDAEDIIADYELRFIKQERQRASTSKRFTLFCSPSFLIFRHQMGKELGIINQKIGSLTEKMRTYLPTAPNQVRVDMGNHPVRYHKLINDTEIVGLKDDSIKIMNWILQANRSLSVIGIVGMGGIGKTTLAQKIYNNDNIQRHFQHKLFIVISQSFDLKEIIKVMLRKLNMEEDKLMRDEEGLLQQLSEELKGKYFLIFDDVWNTDEDERESSWWESLKSALPKRNDGSCVIVTTRKEGVGRSMGAIESLIHRPQLLCVDESWSLFSKIAFVEEGGRCPNQELEDIGKEIVSQCCGLPLVIKVVGGIMPGKGFSRWKQVSDHLKEELAVHKEGKSVFSTLQLSYEELPMHLKPCMLCFAAFPEDFDVHMNDMIYWWIGEGFIQGRDEKTKYEIGEEWWTELAGRGFLLGGSLKDHFERFFFSCRVHDMVRDMIIKIVKEENFMDLDDGGNRTLDIHSRRLSIMNTTIDNLFGREVISKLSRMRTLIVENIKKRDFISKLYHLKWLRVLVIEFKNGMDDKKDEWWTGIGSLLHLIYLRIKNS